jgi:hypothetical protein
MVSTVQFIDMRFDVFEKLSEKEARAFLRRFLEVESSNIKKTMKRCKADGIKMDFTIESIGIPINRARQTYCGLGCGDKLSPPQSQIHARQNFRPMK